MPFFRDKNLLFIHIPKNAGMYVEMLLGMPQSIVSYDTPTSGGLFRHLRSLKHRLVHKDESKEKLEREYLHGYFGGGYAFQHATLAEVVQMRLLDEEVLNNCRIIAVHRHPVSRAISIYKYWGFYREMDFEGFCRIYVAKPWQCHLTHSQLAHLRSQCSYIDGADILSKRVNLLSFENLSEDISRMSNEYGLNLQVNKAVNVSEKMDIDVTPESLNIIRNVYAEDFDRFGYDSDLRRNLEM